MYARYMSCTIVDGVKKTPALIDSWGTSDRVGHEMEIREKSFVMTAPLIVNKRDDVVTPATYAVGDAGYLNKRHLFTLRKDGKYRLKGSRTAELLIGVSEANQVFA